MDIKQLTSRALEVREKYSELEKERYGRSWNNGEIMQGFVVDMGELTELVMAKEGIRRVDDVDQKFEHEIADCLYSLLILAGKYNVDLEEIFLKNMEALDVRITSLRNNN